MYINDDEVSKMLAKMSMLYACCEIKDLGYRYDDNECVIIDLFVNEGGYGGIGEYDIIESIIKPTIGDDGFVGYNCDNVEKLKELGAEIPISSYSDEDAVGALFLIANEHTIKFAKYELEPNDSIKQAICSLDFSIFCDESTVENVQIFFKKEGMYIVCPEEYLCVEEFLSAYTNLLKAVMEQVAEAEKSIKIKEAV